MKKIGIITFHRSHNYGAVLQAYAMKRIFSAYGDAELVDYWPSDHNRFYTLFHFDFLHKGISLKRRLTHFKRFLGEVKHYPARSTKAKKFQHFISRYLCTTDEGLFENSERIPQHYDAYVYGSDQIWRAFDWDKRNYPLPDLVYYGKGVPDAAFRLSYAASMGKLDVDALRKPDVTALLQKFDFLSTREGYLADFLRTHLTREVAQVLDPTLLIAKDEWIRLVDTEPFTKKGNYVVSYNLLNSLEARTLAQDATQSLGIPCLEIVGSAYGPIDFLQMIRHADLVICTSFHAVVFSILFNRNFYVIGMNENVGRVSSLLRELSLQERILETPDAADFSKKVDYSPVIEKLETLIDNSRSFIKEAMSEFLRR